MSQEVYCEVVGKEVGLFKKKVEVEVDMGQEKGWLERMVGDPLKDENGRVVRFNSMIDALNHMAKDGWLFVNAYSITFKEQNVYHYVMRKIIT